MLISQLPTTSLSTSLNLPFRKNETVPCACTSRIIGSTEMSSTRCCRSSKTTTLMVLPDFLPSSPASSPIACTTSTSGVSWNKRRMTSYVPIPRACYASSVANKPSVLLSWTSIPPRQPMSTFSWTSNWHRSAASCRNATWTTTSQPILPTTVSAAKPAKVIC